MKRIFFILIALCSFVFVSAAEPEKTKEKGPFPKEFTSTYLAKLLALNYKEQLESLCQNNKPEESTSITLHEFNSDICEVHKQSFLNFYINCAEQLINHMKNSSQNALRIEFNKLAKFPPCVCDELFLLLSNITANYLQEIALDYDDIDCLPIHIIKNLHIKEIIIHGYLCTYNSSVEKLQNLRKQIHPIQVLCATRYNF